MNIHIRSVRYLTRGTFIISRSAVNHVDVVEVQLSGAGHIGRGECRPYARYHDTVESVTAQLEALRQMIESGEIKAALDALPAGPAKNALDAASLDLTAKVTGIAVWSQLHLEKPNPRQTAFTLSWGAAETMAEAARMAADYPWLKLKIGEGGLDRVKAVAQMRPDAKLILDANEALTLDSLPGFLRELDGLKIALIEQPLPAGHATDLPPSDIPICADEGLHTVNDLPRLKGQGYSAVNVKLDKCGGLTAGVKLIRKAREMDFTVMAGCMVGSSLAMAPMMTAESLCDIIDLDGPLLLAQDISGGLQYEGPMIYPPHQDFWGQ